MRYTALLLIALAAACDDGEISVRQRFLAQSSVSVQFEAWARALNNQDLDSLALVYHHDPELRILGIDGTVSHGWEEEHTRQIAFLDSTELVNFVPSEPEIQLLGKEMVLTIFRHTLDIVHTDGQREPTVRGLGTILWKKDPADDNWKILVMQLAARQRSGELEM